MAKKRSVKQRRKGKTRRSNSQKRGHFRQILMKVKKLKSPQRLQALRLANSKFIREFCSHVRKLRHAKLSQTKMKKLKRHSKILRKLANNKSSIKVKRQILSQKGSGFIFPLLASLIPSVIGSIVGRR